MKAVRIHAYGGRDVLCYEEAPRPVPAEGEVLIRVYASSVNPFDCAARSGYLTSYFNYTLPLILGTDVSGTIEEVGPGVTGFAPGDSVYARAGVTRDGSYAEYVAVPAAQALPVPDGMSMVEAALSNARPP